MQGGEGMVAVVQGLRDAGLAVTVVNRTYLQNAMKRDSRRRIPANQSSAETNTDHRTQNSSTQMCERYTSNYQQTHGNNSFPNTSGKQMSQNCPEFPLQRAEPSRTAGNFQIGSAIGMAEQSAVNSTQTFKGAPMRPYSRGSIFSNSSSPRQSDAFISSLRRYPLPDSSVSTELVQRLLNYTQTKHFSGKDSVSMRSLRNKSIHRTRESKEPRRFRESEEYNVGRESRAARRAKESRESIRDFRVNGARKFLEFRRIRAHRDSRRDRVYDMVRAVSEPREIRESDEENIIRDSIVQRDSKECQGLSEGRIKYSKSKEPVYHSKGKEIRQVREIIATDSRDNSVSRRIGTSRNECKDSEDSIESRDPRGSIKEKYSFKENKNYKRVDKSLDIEDYIEPNETKNSRNRRKEKFKRHRDYLKISDSNDIIESMDVTERKESREPREFKTEETNYSRVKNNFIERNEDEAIHKFKNIETPEKIKFRNREDRKNTVNDSKEIDEHREFRGSIDIRESIEQKELREPRESRTTRKFRDAKRNRKSKKSRRVSDSRRYTKTNAYVQVGKFIELREPRGNNITRDKNTEIKVNKFMQTYTRTSNEMLLEGAGKSRNARSSLEDTRYKDQLSETYNYLKSTYSGRRTYAGRAQEIRYLHEMTRCVRDAVQQILGPPVVCPAMQDRYIHHRREHHHDTEETVPADEICITQPSSSRDVSVSFRCRPPLGTRRTCIFRSPIPPCPCDEPDPKSLNQTTGTSELEEDIDASSIESYKSLDLSDGDHSSASFQSEAEEAAILNQLEDNIYEHINDIAVIAGDSPELVSKCNKIIRDLAKELKELQGQKDFTEKAKAKVTKCINKLPMWFPGEKEDEPQLIDEMADAILGNLNINENTFPNSLHAAKKVKRLKTKNDKKIIGKWLNNIPTLTEDSKEDNTNKAKIASQLAFELNNIEDWKGNKEEVKEVIRKYLDTLPMWLPGANLDREKFQNQIIDNLLNKLDIDHNGITIESSDKTIEDKIIEWVDNLPTPVKDFPETENKIDEIVEQLALTVSRLRNRDDYEERVKKKIKEAMFTLPVLLPGSQDSQEILRNQLADNLIKNLNNDESTLHENIRDWVEDLPVHNNNPISQAKKNAIAKELASKVNHLIGSEDFVDMARGGMRTMMDNIPMWLPQNTDDQTAFKDQLVGNLLEYLNVNKPNEFNYVEKVENQIQSWLNNTPIYAKNTPEVEKQKKNLAKTLSKELYLLKDQSDFDKKAKKMIKIHLDKLPLEWPATEQNKEKLKRQLADNLLDNILNSDESKSIASEQVKDCVRDWLQDISISTNNDLKSKVKNEEVVQELTHTLKGLVGHPHYREKAIYEIKKCIEALPIDLSGKTNNKKQDLNQLAKNLVESILNEQKSKDPSEYAIADEIRDWLDAEPVFASMVSDDNPKTNAKKEKVVKDLAQKLKRLKGRDDYQEKANEEIRKSIGALPMELSGTKQGQEKIKKQLAESLLGNIFKVGESKTPTTGDTEDQIRDWLEAEPAFADDSPMSKARKEKVATDLARNLKRLKGCDNYEKKALDEIKKHIDTLPVSLSGSITYTRKAIERMSCDLLDNILNVDKVQSPLEKTYHKVIRDWLQEVPCFTDENSGTDAKKEKVIKDIARELMRLKSLDDFKEKALEEIKKIIESLPLDIPGTKRNQDMVKEHLVDSLLDNIMNIKEPRISADYEMENTVLNWLDLMSTGTKGILKNKANRNKIAKQLTSKLKLLKDRDDYEENAKTEISKVVDSLDLLGTNQDQLKSQLVDSLLEKNKVGDISNNKLGSLGESKKTNKKVDLIDQRVDKEIRDWLEILPVYTEDIPSNKAKREKIIRELTVKLKHLKGLDDFKEKAEAEIKKLVINLPLELHGSDSYQEIVRNDLTDKLLENVLDAVESNNADDEKVKAIIRRGTRFFPKVYPEDEIIEDQILEWLEEVPITDETPKIKAKNKEGAKNLADSLKRLKGRGDFEEKAREEIKKYINNLPMELTGTKDNQEMVINRLVDTLLDSLNESGKSNLENSKASSLKKTRSSGEEFYEPINLKVNIGETSQQRRPSGKSASYSGQTDLNDKEERNYSRSRRSSDNGNDGVFYHPSALKNSSNNSYDRSRSADKHEYSKEKTKDPIYNQRIPEEQEEFEDMFKTDTNEAIIDNVIEEQIIKWLKKVPVFRTDNEENKVKKEETVKELASKLQNLIKSDDYEEKAKGEIKDYIDILPMFFPGSKRDQEKSKNEMAGTLINMIHNEKLNVLKGVIMDWFNEINILQEKDSSGKKVDKDKISDSFAEMLLPFVTKPINVLKEEIINLIEGLPVKDIKGNKKQSISEIAIKFIRKLKPNANIEEEVVYESEFEEHIWKWLEDATVLCNDIKKKNQYLVKKFVQRLKDLKPEDDYAIKKEIGDFMESLISEGIELSSRQKRELIKNILKEINYRDLLNYNLYEQGNEIPESIVDKISELVDDIPSNITSKVRENIKEHIADVLAPNVFNLSNNDKVQREVAGILKKDAKMPSTESKNLAGEIIFKVNGMDFPLNFRRGTITEMEMRDIVKEEVTVILDDFDIPSENKSEAEANVTDILADQIVRDIDDATTENQIVSVLINAQIADDDIEPLTHRLMRRNREMSVCYRSPDKSLKFLMKSSDTESFLLSPTERRTFVEKAEQEISDFNGEITGDDSAEARLKRKPDVVNLAAKVVMLMADPNGIAREARIMREISEYFYLPSIETNDDNEKLSKHLRQLLRNIDYKTSIQTSTPQNDRVGYFIPQRFSADISAIDFDEDEDNRPKKRQRSKSKTQSQLLSDEAFSYSDLLVHAIKLWMDEVGLIVNMPDEQGFKNNMCKDLASDVIDRQKYLESTATSEKEELDHLKYQLFRLLKKNIDPEHLTEIVSTASILMDKINAVPILQLVDPDKLRQSMSLTGEASLFKRDSSLFIAENLEGAILLWMKRQPFYQETSLEDKKLQESLVPELAHAIKSAILNAQSASLVDNDDLLIEEIVKQFKDFPMDFQYKTMHIYDLAKKLLNHLKRLQLFQDISHRATVNESSLTPIEKDEQGYKQVLCRTISEILPHDVLTKGDQVPFEVLKDDVADAFINLHYVGGNQEKNIIKTKIHDVIDKFFNDYLKRYPSTPIDTQKLNRDLYIALQNVPIPDEESFRKDAEVIKIKNEISNWIKELLIEEQTDSEKWETRKIISELAKKIHEIELQKDLNPDDDDYDENMKREIQKVIAKIPSLGINRDDDLKKITRKLINKLNDTKESRKLETSISYTQFLPPGLPPCAISMEDQAHLQRIRQRASLRLRGWSPCCTYFSPPSVEAGSQTEILCAGPLCQGPRTCQGKSTNLHQIAKQSSGVQTPTQSMQAVGSQIALSPQVIIKEYYWDSMESSLATPCVPSPKPCTSSRCTMTGPILSQRSILCSAPPGQFSCESQPLPNIPQRGQPCPSPCPLSLPMPAHSNVCQQTGQYTTCQSPSAKSMTDNVSQPQRSQHSFSNVNLQRRLPTDSPCSPHPTQGHSFAQSMPQTRPQHQMPCSSRRPWYASQELISSEEAETRCSFRKARVSHLGSFDQMAPTPSKSRDSNWVYPENDSEFWEGNRRCLISEDVDQPCMIDRQRKGERVKCRCKERTASKYSGRKGARGNSRCGHSPNRNPVSSCSKCWGVHCPYPSYMFFR